ncbi:hypothetical protein JFY64_02565 [Porphyromonas gingivalis]|uniref:hypothetical protein n=1 Tax=Porphyromonas gingivalis TaxID=837 RepID=UPI000B4E17BA|nr:hypothetical protein [Porphyromonas gingivalis]MCE8191018.1 hypothetical protein [Porphyromonas gingivalis]OWR80068.1 hypothetical protein SJDPG4_03355 [Porphyromonas gingivalis SJD4]
MAVLLVNDDFGVIFSSHRGKGALSAETESVGQRHTLPVSRDDADEASLPSGATSMEKVLHFLFLCKVRGLL